MPWFPQSEDSHRYLHLAQRNYIKSSTSLCDVLPKQQQAQSSINNGPQPFSRIRPLRLILKSWYNITFCKLWEATVIRCLLWLNCRRLRLFVLFFIQYQIFLREKCPWFKGVFAKIKPQVIRMQLMAMKSQRTLCMYRAAQHCALNNVIGVFHTVCTRRCPTNVCVPLSVLFLFVTIMKDVRRGTDLKREFL